MITEEVLTTAMAHCFDRIHQQRLVAYIDNTFERIVIDQYIIPINTIKIPGLYIYGGHDLGTLSALKNDIEKQDCFELIFDNLDGEIYY